MENTIYEMVCPNCRHNKFRSTTMENIVECDKCNKSLVKNNVPEIEFGQVKGSLSWAIEEVRENGEVYHEESLNKFTFKDETRNDSSLHNSNGNVVCAGLSSNKGWYRKPKTDKEVLVKEYLKSRGFSSDDTIEEEFVNVYEFIEKQGFKVTKK